MGQIEDFWKGRDPVIENMLLREGAVEIDRLERPEVMSRIPPFIGMNVLDLGAGIGRFTTEFAKKAGSVTALDFVPQFIECNKKHNAQFSNIVYLCADAKTVDFPKNCFDLIFVSGFFMYLDDGEFARIAHKISNWLKIGGHLFFRDCCSPHSQTVFEQYSYRRSIYHYHKLMDPLLTHIDSGSIQVYIDHFANPFRCYWLYRKDRIESADK
ncbi:MAG: methyltransferase domain-containing protein [Chlamydiales bacterium]